MTLRDYIVKGIQNPNDDNFETPSQMMARLIREEIDNDIIAQYGDIFNGKSLDNKAIK